MFCIFCFGSRLSVSPRVADAVAARTALTLRPARTTWTARTARSLSLQIQMMLMLVLLPEDFLVFVCCTFFFA